MSFKIASNTTDYKNSGVNHGGQLKKMDEKLGLTIGC